jgi:Ca-activated chloride channel family protein
MKRNNTVTSGLINSETKEEIALLGVDVHVKMKDVISKVKIRQHYKNNEDKPIEVTYCFPVESGSVIYGMKISLDGREITASAEKKDNAFNAYSEALDNGDGAFLLEKMEDDIMFMSAGNMKPGSEAVVEIEYATVLNVTDDKIRLQIPTTVSPRYIPSDMDPVKADMISPPVADSVPYGISIKVELDSPDFKTLSSPSHKIKISRENSSAYVTFTTEKTALDRDFIIEYEPAESHKPICLIEDNGDKGKSALIRLYPEFNEEQESQEEISLNEVIFVIDCSGSMCGSSIESAKKALECCLRTLNKGDYFNIIKFGSGYTLFSDKSLPFNRENFNKALKYVRDTDADMGGTELHSTVEFICQDKENPSGLPRNVILLTDGEVGNTGNLIKYVSENSSGIRFFTLGIGYGASQSLINGLAEVTKGAAEMIQPGEMIEEKVLRQFSRKNQPYVNNLKIDVRNGKFEICGRIPPVFEGDSLTLFADVTEYSPSTEVILSGTCMEKRVEWKAEAEVTDMDGVIPVLCAAEKIRSIEYNSEVLTDEDRQKICNLALKYNLMSSETSFVGVEKRSEDGKTFDPEYRRIPINLVKDYGARLYSNSLNSQSFLSGAYFDISNIVQSCISMPNISNFSHSKNLFQHSTPLIQKDNCSKEKSEFIKLLSTQDIDGYFDCLNFFCTYFSIAKDKLQTAIADAVRNIKSNLNKDTLIKAVLTFAAVEFISKDPDFSLSCKDARIKAEKWLSQNIYSHIEEKIIAEAAEKCGLLKF